MTNAAARDAGSGPVSRGIDRAGRMLLGGVGLAVRAGRAASVGAGGRAPERSATSPLLETALGLALVAQRRASDIAAAMALPVEAAGSVLARLVMFGADVTGVRQRAEDWARLGRAQQRRNEQMATEALGASLRAAVAFAVDEIEVDEIVAQVDIDAVLARIDMAELVQRVLDEVDLVRIVRESSSGMATESVDAVRTQSMRADHAVNRVVDRLLSRRSGRVTRLGLEPDTTLGTGP